MLKLGQSVSMVRNASAQSLDHSRSTRDLSRTVATTESLSWSLLDEKVGPHGQIAAFGSQSAWEAQMECALKVQRSVRQLI